MTDIKKSYGRRPVEKPLELIQVTGPLNYSGYCFPHVNFLISSLARNVEVYGR